MSGAVSFVLGLLGFGAAGGVSAVQGVSQRKKEAELAEMYGWNADTETQKMRKRVEEEWRQNASWNHNCLGETWYLPDSCMSIPMMRKRWFRRHLEAKGIPYDEVILDKVTGVSFERLQKQMLNDVRHR